MLKKILSFVLVLCLCFGITANTNVYASENQEKEEITIVMEKGDSDGQSTPVEQEVLIPQNGSNVNMESAESPKSAYSHRTNPESGLERYTVLVLDNSASSSFSYNGSIFYTADTALPHVKKASKKFIEDVQKASGSNYVAIVSYRGDTSTIVSQFTDDTGKLEKAIDSLYASGGSRSVYNGLAAADKLIDSVSNQNAIKNVVLFSTGMTNDGIHNYTGQYNTSTIASEWYRSDTRIHLYAYANTAYAAAEQLKGKSTVYSIGLFNTMENMPAQGLDVVQFFKLCARDWATSEKYFYDVKNPDDLEFIFGQVAENIVKRTGTFSYPGIGKDYTSTYYYDDNYFKNSSYIYNPNLATMSLCLELSSWGSEEEPDYARKMKNAETLFNELGFIGFDHNYTDAKEDGITGKPTKDSIGAVAANKKISFDDGDYTLIAIAVRGGGYEREWAGNFKIGEDGAHQGFSEASDKVISFLENYVDEQGISGNIKIWITGYSRAAATANMTAGAIDDGKVDLSGCNLELKDLFAYTFETPAGVTSGRNDGKYNNINNVINRGDIVPMVAPRYWGFGRYGIDRVLPSAETDGVKAYSAKLEAMLQKYRELEGYESYDVDNFKMKKINIDGWSVLPGGDPFVSIEDDTANALPQSLFLNNYVTMLVKDFIKNRTNYVARYQEGIRDACGIFFGTSPAKTDKLMELAAEKFKSNWGGILWEFLRPFGGEIAGYEKIAEYLRECLNEAEITNYSQEDFDRSVTLILDLVAAVASNHPNLATTLAMNISGIGQAHYPELCLAWMQSMDTNYTTDAGSSFSTGKYRIIRINCPVDVTVYDTEGKMLTSVVNNEPQPDGDILAAFNEDDEKLVYLPVNHDYVVKLTATGEGVMNYAVQEYDPYAGETNHLVLFNDIQITKGQEYTAYLPGYGEEEMEDNTGTAAETEYTLFAGETKISPSEELTDKDVFDAYYNIDVAADDSATGIVFGSGIRQLGTFAKITAKAYDGYEFAGWYEEGNLISAELEYRFRVSKDMKLTAAFKPIAPQSGLKGEFKVVSQWNTGFDGEITLTNTTEEVIHNWVVDFDLPYEITSIWDGVITAHDNGVYTVKNTVYNWDINPGKSVTFGFIAKTDTETITEPTYYTLVKVPDNTVTQNLEFDYKVNSGWGTDFNGQIEIKNLSSKDLFDWTLEFDFENDIREFWNADIVSHVGNHYVIRNKGYNASIEAGQTLTLGFGANSVNGNSNESPVNYNFTSIDMN